MFELQISDPDITSGSIPVSWCLDANTMTVIKEKYGNNPTVVLVLTPTQNYHLKKETRQIVPLRDLMAFLDFKVSGPNKIWAFITSESLKSAQNHYLAFSGGSFDTRLLNY